MAFNAATEVEDLNFDFTKYGGPVGTIAEPSVEQVADFWAEYTGLVRGAQARVAKTLKDRTGADGEVIEQTDEEIKEEILNGKHMSVETAHERNKLLAKLGGATVNEAGVVVGGSPTLEEIEMLPARIQLAFEGWLIASLNPQA